MGNANSSLYELSTDEVSSFVTDLGDKYKPYEDTIAANGVDGELLMEIEDVDELKQTLQCLEINNFLHQKMLIKEWKKAKAAASSIGKRKNQNVPAATTYLASDSDASEITMDTALSPGRTISNPSSPATNYCRRMVDPEPLLEDPPIPLAVSMRQKRFIEQFEFHKSEKPDHPALEPFHQLATQAIGDLKGSFAQVNLLDVEMMERKGVNSLASTTPATLDAPMRIHFDGENDDRAICRKFILGSQEDFRVEDIPLEVSTAFGLKEPAKYYGHIVQFGNLRVGTICISIEETPGKATSLPEKKEILQLLASLVKGQLEKRAALLQRKHNLEQDLRQIKESGVDPVLAPPVGPLRAVTASEIAKRKTNFPYPNEPGQHPNGCPTKPQFTRRSASLPAFRIQANQAERAHLKPTYYKDPAFESTSDIMALDLSPVGKRDMEQVALLHALQLLEMERSCSEAESIQSLVDLTGVLLDVDFVFVALLTHEHANVSFVSFPKGPWPKGQKMDPEPNIPNTGPLMQFNRAITMCNYTLASPNRQAFVVHDVTKDESVARLKKDFDFGFYSSAPIVIQGLAVGSLCCFRSDPNPEFGRVQEMQQEQLAELIAQQYETWALSRESQQLEPGKSSISNPPGCISPPENYAALVFTGIQGAEGLLETNTDAMGKALELHNQILNSKVDEFGGYIVTAEGSTYHIAFADVGDAVRFCLKTQEALHAAAWREDLLVLPQAHDTGAFRGLRVKMAVHCGEVNSMSDSGQVKYTGETFHIAANLESMAHGGQILVTSDVWSVASGLLCEISTPQAIDLGSHIVPTGSSNMHDGVTTKRILQLVPASLAFDYLQMRKRSEEAISANYAGRTFPRIKTRKSVSASFHDAPFGGNKVTLLSIGISEAEKDFIDSHYMAALSSCIHARLKEQQPDGYQCDDFLLAFDNPGSAVRFGLELQEHVDKRNILDKSLRGKLRIGVHEGLFDTMGPNPITGRARYFGSVIERVAAVTNYAAPGSVVMAKLAEEMDEFSLQPIMNGFMLDFRGRKSFQGIDEDFSLYNCLPCKSWYDQIVDRRNGRGSMHWQGYA